MVSVILISGCTNLRNSFKYSVHSETSRSHLIKRLVSNSLRHLFVKKYVYNLSSPHAKLDSILSLSHLRRLFAKTSFMKKINVLYWVFTGLFAAAMLFSSIGNIMVDEASVQLITDILHFPKYMIPFLGIAKVIGVVGILLPGIPRWIREWSYAGLFFDLAGACYAIVSSVGFHVNQLGMLMFIIPGVLSYYYFHKKYDLRPTLAN